MEVLLQGVRTSSVIGSEETVSKDKFKTSWSNEKLSSWREKRLHGQFVREIRETTHVEESWSWLQLRKVDLLCGEKGGRVNHIVFDGKKLAQREYKQRHDNVAKVVHWKLCGNYHLEKKDNWNKHGPDSVSENDEVKLLWDVNIQCDHVIEARRPDRFL